MLRPLALVALLALALPGCTGPTVPIPPPAAITVSAPDADGLVSISGTAQPLAIVSALNQRTELGVLVVADEEGAFGLAIAAEAGDDISLWNRLADTTSGVTTVTVPEP